jgi:hypothetical protein
MQQSHLDTHLQLHELHELIIQQPLLERLIEQLIYRLAYSGQIHCCCLMDAQVSG